MPSKIWKARFKNPKGRTEKICIYCGIKLIVGETVYKDFVKTHTYICKKCESKRKRQYSRDVYRYRRLTYKGKRINIDPDKLGRKDYCEICKRSLKRKKSIMHHFAYDDEHPERFTATLCFNCHNIIHFSNDIGLQKIFKDIEKWCERYIQIRETILLKDRVADMFGAEVNRQKRN